MTLWLVFVGYLGWLVVSVWLAAELINADLLRLPRTLFGSQTTQAPEDHPRWDGEQIRPYDWERDDEPEEAA